MYVCICVCMVRRQLIPCLYVVRIPIPATLQHSVNQGRGKARVGRGGGGIGRQGGREEWDGGSNGRGVKLISPAAP